MYMCVCVYSNLFFQLGLPNTSTASLQRCKTQPTSVVDMTLNNLMMNLQ